MDTTGIPPELCSIASTLKALPPSSQDSAQNQIHHTHLSALEAAVIQAVREAIRHTKGHDAAGTWQRTGAPARYTERDLYLQARRHGAADELMEQGFTLPDDTPATVTARAARLAELWAEVKDLAGDLATSGVHGAKRKVADALEISVDTVDRKFVPKA
ncbi:hypothetical protein ACIHJG_35775 [Streptomyces sp. NPDC052415]|uniref:hypothetical protein n=1 Tax=Streptomyces sp. NPDC052415 TaxID=3365690 RepID=UPI0037D2A017